MKKILLITAFILGLTLCLSAQTNPAAPDSVITHQQLKDLNSGAETGLTLLLGIVAKNYPIATPFIGILVTVIMGLIRKAEKRLLKKKIATDLEAIDKNHPLNEQNAPTTSREHRSAIGRLIDRLKGEKPKAG